MVYPWVVVAHSVLAMLNPELFSAAAAFSSSIRTDEEILARDQSSFDDYSGRALGAGAQRARSVCPIFIEKTILFSTSPKLLMSIN